jgi:hypothetical protein
VANRSDNFNRADSTSALGSPSDGGSDWVAAAGTWGISSNTGYKVSSAAFQSAYLEASSATCSVSFTVAAQGNGGLVGRLANDNNFIYGQVVSNSTVCYVYRKVGGTFTQIGPSATVTHTVGDVWLLSIDSSDNILLKQNGTTRITTSSSSGSTNTKWGLCDFAMNTRYENFEVIDLAGGASAYSPGRLSRAFPRPILNF